MKHLLYLKDEQIKDFIQLISYAYRETFSDPKEILAKKFFGAAHLRVLNLVERNPGISLGELIFKLKVTNSALRSVDKKGGIDKFLKEAKLINLSHRVKKIKKNLLAKN